MARLSSLLAACLLAGPLAANANTINGCVHQKSGKLRLVADPGQCKDGKEAPISWNSEGPQGAKGDPGDAQCVVAPELREFGVVGITSARTDGFLHPWELDELCNSEFQGSRVCWGVQHWRLKPGLDAATLLASMDPITVDGTEIGGGAFMFVSESQDGKYCHINPTEEIAGRVRLVGFQLGSSSFITREVDCRDLAPEDRRVACCNRVR